MEKKSYYKILGVDEKATQDEIKKQYRKKSKLCHPDLFPDDKSKVLEFQELNEANEVLSDPEKRRNYDNPNAHRYMGGEPGFGFDFSDLFHGRNRASDRVANLRMAASVSIEDYIKSAKVKINYSRIKFTNSDKIKCSSCAGKGFEEYNHGEKYMCGNCSGTGFFQKSETVNEIIDLEIKYGQMQYVFVGKGAANGPSTYGALLVDLTLSPTKDFTFDANTGNIQHNVKLSLKEYITGASIYIPHLIAPLKITHTNDGEISRMYRLKYQGIKLTNNHITDLIVVVSPKIPTNLTPEQSELVDKLCEGENFNVQRRIP